MFANKNQKGEGLKKERQSQKANHSAITLPEVNWDSPQNGGNFTQGLQHKRRVQEELKSQNYGEVSSE